MKKHCRLVVLHVVSSDPHTVQGLQRTHNTCTSAHGQQSIRCVSLSCAAELRWIFSGPCSTDGRCAPAAAVSFQQYEQEISCTKLLEGGAAPPPVLLEPHEPNIVLDIFSSGRLGPLARGSGCVHVAVFLQQRQSQTVHVAGTGSGSCAFAALEFLCLLFLWHLVSESRRAP